MDNKIEVFKNEQFGEVRTILDGETLLFCGSDVARALGYARPGKAIIDHCKGVLKRDTLTSGGTQSLSYITEGDVYRLIVHSKLPSAERFEHWLFDEVVPMIRKTGCYMTESLLDRIQKEPAVIIELAQTLLKETNRANALEAELGIARPKADYRVNKTRDFTVMGNTHLRDKNLSLKAVGLLSKMLSFNDGWQFSTRGLAALCKEGPDAILSALKELEENGYLVRHRGRDDKGRMVSTEFDIYEMPQAGLPHRDNPHRENPDVENPDVENPHRENPAQRNTIQVITQERNTLSKNYQSINLDGMDRMDERSEYEEIIKENLDYNILCQDPKFDKDRFREIMDIMLDAVCSTAPTIRINGEDMPQQVVKSRFLKLNSSHIEYVLEAMNKNPSDIRNIRAYLLTALYNASLTIDNYYSALVNHDFYGQDRSAGSKKPKTYDYSLCEDTL